MNRADVITRLRAAEPTLREHGVEALFLYGSYARDEAKPGSDIDILVDFLPGRGSGLANFLAPVKAIEASFPGIEIGYGTRETIVPRYLPSIAKSAIRVF